MQHCDYSRCAGAVAQSGGELALAPPGLCVRGHPQFTWTLTESSRGSVTRNLLSRSPFLWETGQVALWDMNRVQSGTERRLQLVVLG